MTVKSQEELELMRTAGRVVGGFLRLIEKEIKPGVTTKRLDEIAEEFIRSHGTVPAFKGYYGYPATICASVNEEVVHGIPGPRVLKEGDIIGVDVGAIFKDYYADAARTFAVGRVGEEDERHMAVTQKSLEEGIAKAVEGNRLSDISWAVQSFAEKSGFSVVREYVGHGIGKHLHEEPQVPNFGPPGNGPRLLEGMTLAIEPMLNRGTHEVKVLDDGWTVVTRDGQRSCHFEQTVFVGKKKAEVITD